VKNVSRTGIGLVVDHYIPLRSVVSIEVPAIATGQSLALNAEVVFCLRYSADHWLVGMRFETALNERQLRVLLVNWR
jgi:hypothetical protein